ncbi:MAG: hypothetical protein ACP6IQ_04790 [Candidatus Njordarchaeia archaeon]
MIKEIELINFMSHRHTKISLVRGINVLVGKKGSGKTAIIEAIKLAFGGSGKLRQNYLKDYIRHEAPESIIRLTIRNGIKMPNGNLVRLFENLPANSNIVIERIIRRDGQSLLKVNGSNTRRSDLIKKLLRVNIDPKNMLFFIPQEHVNIWLKKNSKERIDLLLSALGLLELKEKIQNVRKEIEDKTKERDKYIRALNEWKTRLVEEEKSIVAPDIAWKELINYYVFRIAELVYRKKSIESNIEKLKEKEQDLKKEAADLKIFIEEFDRKRKNLDEKIMKIRYEWEKLTGSDLPALENERKVLEEKIKEHQARLIELDEKYEREQSFLNEIKKRWGTTDINELEQIIRQKKEEIKEINQKLLSDEYIRKINLIEDELKQLDDKKRDLYQKLEEQREFTHKIFGKIDPYGIVEDVYNRVTREGIREQILGPILFEIKVNLPIDKLREFIIPIENAIGYRLLSSFVALSDAAYNKLNQIAKNRKFGHHLRVLTISAPKEGRLVSTLTYQLARQMIKIAKEKRKQLKDKIKKVLNRLQGAIPLWVCDVLEAPPPIMAIIESYNWDVPIVVDRDTAAVVMENLDIKKVVTLDGDVIERKSDRLVGASIYTTRVSPYKSEEETLLFNLSSINIEDLRRFEEEVLEEIKELEIESKVLKEKIREMKEDLPLAIKQQNKRKQELEEEINQIKIDEIQIRNALARIQEYPKKRERIIEAIDLLQKRTDEVIDKYMKLKEKIVELKHIEENLQEQKELLISEYGESIARLDSIERELDELPARIKGLEHQKNDILLEISTIKKEIFAIIELLKRVKIHKEEESENILEKEILEPAEQLLRKLSIEEIIAEKERLKVRSENYRREILLMEDRLLALSTIREKVKEYEQKIKKIEIEMNEIEELYKKELRELISSLHKKVEEINKNYKRILKYLNLRGNVKLIGETLNDLKFLITINLHRKKPVSLDRGGFSSGEKTVAIMAMIISMFLTSPAPIYLFDEFDAFLDDESLLQILKIIKTVLREYQGIITTTHREEIIENADKIFVLKFDEVEQETQIIEIMPPLKF